MEEKEFKFNWKVYKNAGELIAEDAALLEAAKAVVDSAYAPYSGFKVAAAVLLENGEIVTGTNQENASYPAGICAEGIALGAARTQFPDVAIKKIAVTARCNDRPVTKPLSPCGICRQRLLEMELYFKRDITIIIAGERGEIFIVPKAKSLLPLYFSSSNLYPPQYHEQN